jgi:serine/threonine-protein kinase
MSRISGSAEKYAASAAFGGCLMLQKGNSGFHGKKLGLDGSRTEIVALRLSRRLSRGRIAASNASQGCRPMVTSDLGACEWFVWDLRRSGLIDRGQLDQIVSEFLKRNPRAEAPALAEYLVDQGTLTTFQAERILNGKTQGLVLGPYVLLDAIGQGSMGQVYKASSKNDNQLYAVKVLPRRSMWNVRLARRQVRSFSQFNHPAVVPFVDVGTAGGLHYLVWPLVEGTTLDTLITQNGKLSVEQTAYIGSQVAKGLMVAHQKNLFHGLIKPSNIQVGTDNQTRILDFGIGSLLVENEGESLVDTMSTANTLTSGLDCASPESILEPTNRTPAGDQYSLGCVLYYCLTGRPPFPEGSAVEKMMAHQSKEPEPIQEFAPEVPEGLIAVIQRLMAKKPEERYAGCDEVVEALEPYVGEYAAALAEPATVGTGRTSGFSGGGGSGSSGRMPGLPSLPGGSNLGPAPHTPIPTTIPATASFSNGFPTPQPAIVPSAARASFGGFPAPMPVKASGQLFPNRASLQGSFAPAEIPLTAAAADPATTLPRSSIPGGLIPGADDRRPTFGTLGVIAMTVLVMVLVYFGAKMLMN